LSICSFVHSSIRPFVHSSIRPFVQPSIRPFVRVLPSRSTPERSLRPAGH
jgi:hypothetical protein